MAISWQSRCSGRSARARACDEATKRVAHSPVFHSCPLTLEWTSGAIVAHSRLGAAPIGVYPGGTAGVWVTRQRGNAENRSGGVGRWESVVEVEARAHIRLPRKSEVRGLLFLLRLLLLVLAQGVELQRVSEVSRRGTSEQCSGPWRERVLSELNVTIAREHVGADRVSGSGSSQAYARPARRLYSMCASRRVSSKLVPA